MLEKTNKIITEFPRFKLSAERIGEVEGFL